MHSNPPKNILIVGATSGMAEALARRYAVAGSRFVLIGRDADKIALIVADLMARGAAEAQGRHWNASEPTLIGEIVAEASRTLERIDLALIAHGSLPDQERAATDMSYAVKQLRINGESAITCMLAIAPHLEKQGCGTLAVIGSVAGDRGRPSNFVYGAAKAAVEACASGLRARLARSGVHLLLIKPGFVATAMTAHLDLPARLTVGPERVAQDIQAAVDRKRDVLYTPWFWAWIMFIIRQIPSTIFKRMSL